MSVWAALRPARLAGQGIAATRLGRDSFLGIGRMQEHRADMRYLIMPMAPLAAASAGGA